MFGHSDASSGRREQLVVDSDRKNALRRYHVDVFGGTPLCQAVVHALGVDERAVAGHAHDPVELELPCSRRDSVRPRLHPRRETRGHPRPRTSSARASSSAPLRRRENDGTAEARRSQRARGGIESSARRRDRRSALAGKRLDAVLAETTVPILLIARRECARSSVSSPNR